MHIELTSSLHLQSVLSSRQRHARAIRLLTNLTTKAAIIGEDSNKAPFIMNVSLYLSPNKFQLRFHKCVAPLCASLFALPAGCHVIRRCEMQIYACCIIDFFFFFFQLLRFSQRTLRVSRLAIKKIEYYNFKN